MTLWMVRHAQPLVEAGICYGQLDMQADAQATQRCAQALAKILPIGITVVTSTLQRCEQLSHTLHTGRADLTIKKDARLQEMNFGHWEGQPWASIDRAELAAWTADFANYRPGGNGESVTSFMARVASAFDDLAQGRDTVWVTHAGVIRAGGLIHQGLRLITRADQWPLDAPAYGQWATFQL